MHVTCSRVYGRHSRSNKYVYTLEAQCIVVVVVVFAAGLVNVNQLAKPNEHRFIELHLLETICLMDDMISDVRTNILDQPCLNPMSPCKAFRTANC